LLRYRFARIALDPADVVLVRQRKDVLPPLVLRSTARDPAKVQLPHETPS
jgi:hypothetical protein